MPPIVPVPSTRISDLLMRRRLLTQMQFDQRELVRLQTQISTGRRIVLPSEEPSAALRATNLQSLIERKDQVRTNLATSQSFLSASDAALASVSELLTDIRSAALEVTDTVRGDEVRQAVAQKVDRAVRQLVDMGNQNFRGRYLFAGTRTALRPFDFAGPFVRYHGNERELRSFSDIDLLTETSVHGSEVFGAVSAAVRSSVDLNPVLTPETLLRDLRGGLGISPGSIEISDGSNVSIVDLSGAVTIGDVARRIEASPPPTRAVAVTITSTGLVMELDAAGGGNLKVNEVGGGTTALELGILEESGVLTAPLVGEDLNPRLLPTTRIDDILGTRATARIVSGGANNDLVITAAANGSAWNGVAIHLVDDDLLRAGGGLTAGNETVQFDGALRAARASLVLAGVGNDIILTATTAGSAFNNVSIELVDAGDVKNNPTAVYSDVGGVRTLTLGIDDSNETTLSDLIAAIQATGLFSVAADPSAGEGFNPLAPVLSANAGVITGNTGNSGGEANTLYVHVQAGASTARDVAAAINAEGTFTATLDPHDALAPSQLGIAPVDASATAVTAGGSGIVLDKGAGIRITSAGETFELSFAGAETIDELLNIINGSAAGMLAQINAQGNGIDLRSRLSGTDFSIGENGGSTATELGIRTLTAETRLADLNKGVGVPTVAGTDFIIVRNDGVQLDIDVSGADTIADVIDLINNHPSNLDPASKVVARLAEYGNGIELLDDNPSGVDASGAPNQLKVLAFASSHAADYLGLIPSGQSISTPPSPATAASAVADLSGPNTDVTITASAPGTQFEGAVVQLVNNLASGDQALVSYSAATRTLTIDVDPTATRALTLVAAVNSEGTFTAALNTVAGPNDGSGLLTDIGPVAQLSGGSPEVLAGADVNLRETQGVFNTLIRLREALQVYNLPEIERLLAALQEDQTRVNFSRAEIGIRAQAAEVITNRLDSEEVELKRTLSEEIDVDLAQAISDFTARQVAYQASLQTAASLLQLTVLDFI